MHYFERNCLKKEIKIIKIGSVVRLSRSKVIYLLQKHSLFFTILTIFNQNLNMGGKVSGLDQNKSQLVLFQNNFKLREKGK